MYPYNSSDSGPNNYNAYKGLKSSTYGYGDAILETSTTGENSTSWNGDYSLFSYADGPFFVRGGRYACEFVGGAFAFGVTYGGPVENDGFRAVLVGV